MSEEADAAISSATEDVGTTAFRVGAGFIEVTVFVRCGARADLAVPADALCGEEADDVSADAVGASAVTAAPTPSATAKPLT